MNPEKREPREEVSPILAPYQGEDAEVTVKRTARKNDPERFEGGWQVVGEDPLRKGNILVHNAEKTKKKSYSPEELASFQPFKIGDRFGEWTISRGEGKGTYMTYKLENGIMTPRVFKKSELIQAEIERLQNELAQEEKEIPLRTLGDAVPQDFDKSQKIKEQIKYWKLKQRFSAYLGRQAEEEGNTESGEENNADFHDLGR